MKQDLKLGDYMLCGHGYAFRITSFSNPSHTAGSCVLQFIRTAPIAVKSLLGRFRVVPYSGEIFIYSQPRKHPYMQDTYDVTSVLDEFEYDLYQATLPNHSS